MTGKKMCIVTLCITLVLLMIVGSLTAYVDPLFHYRVPRDGQAYRLYSHRYQNDGITRHFEYDSILVGTSMIENFKTSQCDALFGTNTIKIPFSGASYKELNNAVVRALSYNPDVNTIFWGVDLARLFSDKDYMRYGSYPDYLYDDALINDIHYLFNKDIFVDDTLSAIEFDIKNDISYTFDLYSNWNDKFTYGRENILANYYRPQATGQIQSFSESDAQIIRGTIQQNLTGVIAANPQIEFYLFVSPYSVVYWDSLNQTGDIQRYIDGLGFAFEMLLSYENVHLFSFLDAFEVTSNLDLYHDSQHFNQDINAQMLDWMYTGEHQVTLENCQAHLQTLADFYLAYPYASIFEE